MHLSSSLLRTRRTPRLIFGLIAKITVATVVLVRPTIAHSASPSSTRWFVAETANFRVWTQTSPEFSAGLANNCDDVRNQLQEKWFGKNSQIKWRPKCELVLHASAAAYQRALGLVSATSGCSTITLESGRVVSRRIDLRYDVADWQTAQLPHELTHVVMADRFSVRRVPCWADEGMAILAEPEEKRAARRRAYQNSRQRGIEYSLTHLVHVEACLTPKWSDAFYGQSALLVQALLDRGTPQQFLEFLDRAADEGYDRALRAVYHIQGIGGLEQILRHEAM